MISVKDLVYKVRMKLNKNVSNQHQDVPIEDIILALNEAQIKLIKKKIDTNNIYKLGLDAFKKRYEDLQSLIVQLEEASVTKTTDIHTGYEADINSLKYNYFVPLDMYTICERGNCKERVVYISKIVKHGDLYILMINSNYAPSFAYQETLSVISGDKIIIYSNDPTGDFIVNKLFLTYLRYPQKIDIAGYIDLDGNPSVNSDCELVDYLEDELLDLTILELAMDTDNTPVIQYDQIRNKNNE